MRLTCRFPLSIKSARRCASYPCRPRCWLLNFVLVMMWIFFFFPHSVAWRTSCPWIMQVFEMEMEQCHNELGLTGNSFPALLLITWSNNLKHLMYLKDRCPCICINKKNYLCKCAVKIVIALIYYSFFASQFRCLMFQTLWQAFPVFSCPIRYGDEQIYSYKSHLSATPLSCRCF